MLVREVNNIYTYNRVSVISINKGREEAVRGNGSDQ
jgi:hypothetical protein